MGDPLKILLVEDEALIAMCLRRDLVKAGYRVDRVSATGEDAVLRAGSEEPDIVLMDCRLGGKIDGIEAARRIHETRDVPIIFMTGYGADEAFVEEAKMAKAAAFLTKPIRFSELKAAIDSCLGKPS